MYLVQNGRLVFSLVEVFPTANSYWVYNTWKWNSMSWFTGDYWLLWWKYCGHKLLCITGWENQGNDHK